MTSVEVFQKFAGSPLCWQSHGRLSFDFPGALALYAPMSRRVVRGIVGLLPLVVLPSPGGAQDEKETVFWRSVGCANELQMEAYLECVRNLLSHSVAWKPAWETGGINNE